MKTKKPRYEKLLQDVEKDLFDFYSAHPKFVKAVTQVIGEARKARPKNTTVAVELVYQAMDAFDADNDDVCKIMLTAAYAMLSDRGRSIYRQAADYMFNRLPLQMPNLPVANGMPPGLPPHVAKAVQEALAICNLEALKEGLNVIKTPLGPVMITKLPLDAPLGVPQCNNPSRN